VEHMAKMGDKRNAYTILGGKREGKPPLGRFRSRWEYNIRVDVTETGTAFISLWLGPSGKLL